MKKTLVFIVAAVFSLSAVAFANEATHTTNSAEKIAVQKGKKKKKSKGKKHAADAAAPAAEGAAPAAPAEGAPAETPAQ